MASSDDDFARAVALLHPDLLRVARRLERSPSAADDLVQDTIERALRYRKAFEPGTHLRAWLFRIQKNLFISRRRRSALGRRVQETMRFDPNAWGRENTSEVTPALSPSVARALDELSPRLGRVVELVDLAEFSYQDAADELDVPVGTIMSRLHRGRARLKERLKERTLSAA